METQVERTKRAPTLPPDYVSLAQLRERWLQKQQQKEKYVDTEQNATVKNQESGLPDGTLETQVENNNNNKKKMKKWKKKKKNKKKKQPLVDEKVENQQNPDFVSEIDKKNEGERLVIVPKKPSHISIGETSGVANGNKLYRVKRVDETEGNCYKKWGNRKRVGSNRSGNNVAERHVVSGKGDQKSKDLEEMSKSEVGVKLGSFKVIDDNGPRGNGLNYEKLVENGAKDDGKVEARKEFGRYWNRSGNGGRKYGRRQDFGDRRLGNKRTVGDGSKSQKSEAEIHEESTKGGEKGKDLEEMSKSEALEVGVKLDGLKVEDGNGAQGKHDSVVGVVLKVDPIAENENKAKGNEKGEAGNRSGNVRRMFGHAAFSDRRSSNAVGNRNYGSSGRLGGGRMNQRDNVKVWVKKEDNAGANAVRVGFTGI